MAAIVFEMMEGLMTDDDKELVETVRLEAEINKNYDGIAFRLLTRIADRIEAISKANRVARLGLIGQIDSNDALEIASTIIDGGNVDWDQYPEATCAALGGKK